MSDSEMRASDEEMDVDMDDPNIKRRGRGFDIRGTAAEVQGDGVRAKNFERLQGEGEEEGIKAAKSIEGWVVLVTNVHEEATEEDVLDKFADSGEVRNCHLNLDRRTGYVKGYALLEFETYSEAQAAIEACQDGLELMEQQLAADFAFVKPPASTRGGRGKSGGGRARGARDARDVRARSPGRR